MFSSVTYNPKEIVTVEQKLVNAKKKEKKVKLEGKQEITVVQSKEERKRRRKLRKRYKRK